MSLDKNLFTLTIKHQTGGVLDLVDGQGTVHYRKRPAFIRSQQDHLDKTEKEQEVQLEKESGVPSFDVYDPLSEGLLATLRSHPSTSTKKRVIQLHNPTVMVDMQFTGSLSFRWQFNWEAHTFEFKKEECFLLRKPDPPVLVAVYELDRKLRPGGVADGESLGQLQLLDYNLTRFDIDDRKGLEIVMLTGILSFQDTIVISPQSGGGGEETGGVLRKGQSANPVPTPAIPPKDPSIAIGNLQSKEKSQVNEIIVTSAYDASLYAEHASNLLKDPNMLYVVFRSKTEAEVPKVVAVAESTKRLWHKGGYDEELHQYVRYDEEKEIKKGPRVIRLDDPGDGANTKGLDYKPPTTLCIHLSKIPMPELQPKAKPNDRLSVRAQPTNRNSDNRMSLNVPMGSGGSSGSGPSKRSPSPQPRPQQQKPARRARTPSPPRSARDREPAKLVQKQNRNDRDRDRERDREREREREREPQRQPQGRPGGGGPGGRRAGSNSPPHRNPRGQQPHIRPANPSSAHNSGGQGQLGPESPRTSFMGFYKPQGGRNAPPPAPPQGGPPRPAHAHRSSSQGDNSAGAETVWNAFWGSQSGQSGGPPPGPRRSPQTHSGAESPIIPGSYPSNYFPSGGPPPPPPAIQPPRPQHHQTGGGGGGLGGFIGGLVPPQSNNNNSSSGGTASQAAHLVGQVGMNLLERLAKR